MTGRNRLQFNVAVLAVSLGVAAFSVGGRAVAAFEQKAVQTTPAQTPPPTATPTQGRGGGQDRGNGPGRPGGPGGGDVFREWEWWKDDVAKRELGLTDKVAMDIDKYYQDRMRRVAPAVEEFRKQSDMLNQMTLERKVEENVYEVQVGQVEALRAKLRESRVVMLYHIYMKLTPEQYKKLADVRDRHYQRGRGSH